jgi:iron complex outermembrane receptor protein
MLMFYANASKGYFFPELRGVRFQSPGVPQTYETEQIIQGELGTKIGTKNFAATAAIFYVGLSDRRSVDFVNDGMGGVIEEVVTQSTQTIGFESSINYFLVEGVAVNALITFQDHEFTKVEANAEQEGNWLRRQPQFKGTIGLTLDRGPWDGNFSATYLGKRYANDANTVELDPYTVVRAGIGYTIGLGEANESLRLGVSVFNLLDSEGITEGSPRQGNAQTGSAEYFVGRPILPRRISIRALFSF